MKCGGKGGGKTNYKNHLRRKHLDNVKVKEFFKSCDNEKSDKMSEVENSHAQLQLPSISTSLPSLEVREI